MEEQRTGKLKEAIKEILREIVKGEIVLETEGMTLAEALHRKISPNYRDPNFVFFADMFRELDGLKGSSELSKEDLRVVTKIYWSADRKDRDEFFNRRRVH